MSSCRKPEIQNNLPKITKIKWICEFLTNSGHKSLAMFYFIMFQLNFKNSEINKIKSYASSWDSNPQSLEFEATEHLRNRMRNENCQKRL